ncbi:sugar transmembrane transporter activity protein [Coemansia javaensis]|uniref:Sugar transporter SWEET1 n=1 Tax=Coemansia javaensis TaxID=2761396 RepID=A0A9W8LEY6_9FUNG|nr:sugar transmembrane transporter activity protein [Coemansia javaensis]
MLLAAVATAVSVAMLVSQLAVVGELRRRSAIAAAATTAAAAATAAGHHHHHHHHHGVPIVQSLASLLSSVLWTKYGAINGDTAVVWVNSLGVAIALYILGCFWAYGGKRRRSVETSVLATTLLAVVMVAAVDYARDPRAADLFSLACCLMSLVFLGSPLSRIGDVVRARDASVLLPSLALLALVNNLLWAAYGARHHDPYMVVPNIVGAVFCSVQLALVAYYGRAAAAAAAAAGGPSPEEVKLADLS